MLEKSTESQMEYLRIVLGIVVVSDFLRTTQSIIMDDGSTLQAPSFLQEPSSRLTFSNDTGSQISCSAHGNPPAIVTWLHKDGSVVNAVPGLRQTPGNGTLYFPPFLGQYYRADVHDEIYRCRASNKAGTVLSRSVHVHAVARQQYDIRVDGKDVILGNTAFLHCHIPEHVRDYVSVTSWYRGDEVLLPEISDVGGRYSVTLGSNDLYIRSVRSEDGLKEFSCLTINTLTGERKLSDPIFLSVKEISSNMAPQTNQKSITEIHVDRGNDIHLPCNVRGNPIPIFTWFRVTDSGALYPLPTSQRIIPSQSILLLKNSDERDSGRWICKASNQFGDQKLEIRLFVNSYLSIHVHPQTQTINSGGRAIFNCSIVGSPIDKIEWFHDGKPIVQDTQGRIKLLSPTSLVILQVGREDRGIYQCMVSNKKSSAQGIAELKLGDTVPELIYTFIEQNVRPGPHISLKCSATGSPPPQFTWLLDSEPILDVSSLHRYAIGQFVDITGDVISHLNISHVRTDDGGLYKCIAANSIGSVSHASRLNVYGPPYIRTSRLKQLLTGTDVTIHCPYSGYPIESIRWKLSEQEIIPNSRYTVASVQDGGFLKINQVDTHDAGRYTCIVRSRSGEEARRDLQVVIKSPPVIEPFAFPKNLQEGGRAQLSCIVSSGDMPVFFSWHKDNAPVPIGLQVTEKKEDFFSILVFKDLTDRHSGRYTCFATNSAAKVNYTAELNVRVPPHWKQEPKDTAVMLGNPISLHCEAGGFPEPTISWFKGQGKMSQDFHLIPLKNNTLTVDFATSDDEGYYMCLAKNDIGSGLKKVIHVNVNEPVRFEYPMKNVSSRRNDPVTLSCIAIGDEPINVVWSHNTARIDLNNYRLNIAEIKTENGVNSQLSISRTDRHDSGRYKCIAENPFGRSEHTIFLAVQERPDAPSNLEVVEVKSRTVKLSWRRPFDGNSPVLSYLVQYQPVKSLHNLPPTIHTTEAEWNSGTTVNVTLPTVSDTLTIDGEPREQAIVSGLHPATAYLIRMLAINEIESSSYTDALIIKTQEEPPVESPQNIQVQTGGMGELIVTWQVPPRDSWNGELLGYMVNYTEDKQAINYVSSSGATNNSIKVRGWATTKTTISGLRMFTRYLVRVQAYNGIASGPWSQPVIGTTLEGVPEASPQNVTCFPAGSQSIRVTWQEPPPEFHGGIIQGYKILYRPLVKQVELSSTTEVKRTSNMETHLHALYKATNYSIRVLAYTKGDGVPSDAKYCSTEEDVPDPPANVKAAALTADSILISWLPPIHKNGIITNYNVYCREAGRKGQAKNHLVRVDENGNPMTFEARNLHENQMYEFWVSATTGSGEGEPTAVIAQATNTRAPASIASFSQTLRRAVGSSLLLECLAVGNPTPRTRWFTRDRPVTFSPFYEVTTDGNLKIHSIETSLTGNYTCQAKNLFGHDEIVYTIVAMKTPSAPQLVVQFSTADSIRVTWEPPDDGGAPIQGYILSYRTGDSGWHRLDFTPEQTSYTITGLKCGNQYILKMMGFNRVGDGHSSDEIIVGTKGKVSTAPDEKDFVQTNATCASISLSQWNNGGCPIHHFSVEHRPLGTIRWTVVSSDISNSEENREKLLFCEFAPATWYQLRVSAINDAGKTTAQFNFGTTTLDGERVAPPEVFPSENDLSHEIATVSGQRNVLPLIVVVIVIIIALLLTMLILRHRRAFCGPSMSGYESRAIPNDIKEEHENRRNQQVYSASPVKTVDKGNESEMYEISPYATFSVAGGRTNASGQVMNAKTPTRGVTSSTLDYTMQFKTFGHPDSDLNATAYPVLPSSGFGHVKGKSSWHKQRYYNTDDESTLSKSMTVVAGSSQIQPHRIKGNRESGSHDSRLINRSKSRSKENRDESESDTSVSPINEFSNAPTYRVPVKSRDMFRPDSSTESNNDNSPLTERRSNTPRHVLQPEVRSRSRQQAPKPRESHSMDMLRSGSNNSFNSEVILEDGLKFHPPSGFTDSREFSEAECDRERALDLEVQRVMENNDMQKVEREELTSLLARYHEKKEKERQEYTIHV
ncbi:cell adhesion molecule Dscam2 isoform X2 [Phlebotomus papatasi]|uniref:cell adhesion molecule Dscam2 isoform X2 n=1 Tax=Phlebotomus papatasi TaxID=29031 RepID=UPI0024845E53|nr:cell adhesion molecule Dscam2 isoform X2 [Phlebotomus papatasi]